MPGSWSDAIFTSPWLGPLVWALLYVSDYRLTIAGARLYRAQTRIAFEGSYELNPQFEKDVNALRRLSPRFLAYLVGITLYLALLAFFLTPRSGLNGLYQLVLGALILLQATIHIRHVRNLYLFKHGTELSSGRIEYRRALTLGVSSLEVAAFAVLYLVLFAFTGSLFVLGGVLSNGALAAKHYKLRGAASHMR